MGLRASISGIFCASIALASVTASAATPPPLKAVPFLSGFTTPVFITQAPGDNTHFYIVEDGNQTGTARIKVFDTTTNTTSTFLTVSGLATSGSEQGLLGMTFDPDFQSNKKFYVTEVTPGSGTDPVDGYPIAGVNKIVEYSASSPTSANTTPVGTLLSFNHPASNHNSGWLGFSPTGIRAGDDHNLYIAMGDGGDSNDTGAGHVTGGNAQSNQRFLGKMLRIHVDPNTATYTIPANNPFATSSDPNVKKEIFAMGLRNPYRDSFDRATGNLYIGDVGQSAREEVDVQPATNAGGGENYQWANKEGFIAGPISGGTGGVDPILDYPRSGGNLTTLAGQTIIGGYVYNGSAIPGLQGWYIFGDYLGAPSSDSAFNNRTGIFATRFDGTNNPGLDVTDTINLTSELNAGATAPIKNISSFGEDNAGELYVVDITGGNIFKLVAAVPEPFSITPLAGGAAFLAVRRRRFLR